MPRVTVRGQIQTQACVMPKNVGVSWKLQTEQKPLSLSALQRDCFPWVLIAGRLSQNQVGVAAAAGLLVGGGRESCVCARVSVWEREIILWSLILGRVSIWGWVVWWANHDNTPQIAMACSKGTMTGLLYYTFQLASALLLLMSVSRVSTVCIWVSGHRKPLPYLLALWQLHHQFSLA